MDELHSFNQFHAAGHGTFFSGRISKGSQTSPGDFLWVYDCGSSRKTVIKALIGDLQRSVGKRPIDMLCISHFDGDHVDGLEILFKSFPVGTLVLPYLPLGRRLELASQVDLDERDAAEVMMFRLDPVGFILRRYPEARIGEFVLIQGGPEPAPDEYEESPQDPPRSDEGGGDDRDRFRTSPFRRTTDVTDDDAYGNLAGDGHQKQRVSVASHSVPMAPVAGLWEFVFFNKDPAQVKKKPPPKPLGKLIAEVRSAVRKFWPPGVAELHDGFSDAIRDCYDEHFGKGSKPRNDISLCLTSRPKRHDVFQQCTLYGSPTSATRCAHLLVPVPASGRRLGLLLTGDVSLDKQTSDDMQRHFGARRWDDIHVMQVPHHGSEKSWEPGVASLCGNTYGALCVPDRSAGHHHPHLSVLEDLKEKKLLFANYSQSVVYAFHKI